MNQIMLNNKLSLLKLYKIRIFLFIDFDNIDHCLYAVYLPTQDKNEHWKTHVHLIS